jgi:hypothetical protein
MPRCASKVEVDVMEELFLYLLPSCRSRTMKLRGADRVRPA